MRVFKSSEHFADPSTASGRLRPTPTKCSEPWTDERVETLKRLWSEGKSAVEAAGILGGVTRNAVIGKVFRLGLTRDESAVRMARSALRPKKFKAKTPRVTRPRSQAVPRQKREQNPFVAFNADRKAHSKPGTDYDRLRSVPVDASAAKPWLERRFGECAYPISGEGADTMSCCQPTQATYCDGHAAAMFYRPKEKPERLERMARRFAA